MDLSALRSLYKNGRLSDVIITSSENGQQWHLDCHDLWGRTLQLSNTKGSAHKYINYDSAVIAAHCIGFNDKELH